MTGSGFTARIFENTEEKEINFKLGLPFTSGKFIYFSGFADPQDNPLDEAADAYNKAMTNYDSVLDNFAATKYPNIDANKITKGEVDITILNKK